VCILHSPFSPLLQNKKKIKKKFEEIFVDIIKIFLINMGY
jgi:hypothetical protein